MECKQGCLMFERILKYSDFQNKTRVLFWEITVRELEIKDFWTKRLTPWNISTISGGLAFTKSRSVVKILHRKVKFSKKLDRTHFHTHLGKVLVAPFRKTSTNSEAMLYSPVLTGPKCLNLEVLMFRKGAKSFSISVVSEKGTSKLVELNGPQGQQWVPLQHSIFLPESLSYKVKPRLKL